MSLPRYGLLLVLILSGCSQGEFAANPRAFQTETIPGAAATYSIPDHTLVAPEQSGKVRLADRSGFKNDSVVRVRLFPILSAFKSDPIKNSEATTVLTVKNPKGVAITVKASGEKRNWSNFTINFSKKVITSGKETLAFKEPVLMLPVDSSVPTEVSIPTDHARLVRTGFLKADQHLAYRGSFVVMNTHDDTSDQARVRLSLVNILPFEDYLDAVVPSELIAETSLPEALKAQAITARTYALRSIINSRCVGRATGCLDRGWDVDPSTNYQSYLGSTAERDNVREAMTSVRGRVITFNNGPILAMFYGSSGGQTAGAKATICRPVRHVRKPVCRQENDSRYPYLTAKKDVYNGNAPRFGHGLGLPQVSAQNMAKKGFSAGAILAEYYVGTKVQMLETATK